MAWDAGSIESRLDVDTSPFHRGLEEAKAEAREFADKRYTTTVDINTKRSQDELSAVESRLHSIESSMDRISTKGGGSGGGGRAGLLSRFAGANLPNPSLMTLGLGAALPLAAPFTALAGGIAGGAVSAGATGLLGLGAFGAGAKGSVGTITKDVAALDKLTKQYDAATTNKQRAAVLTKEAALWKGLDPLQRQAVKNVQGLQGAWHGYQKALEPQTFKLVADGSKIAETGLKYLLPTAKAVGGVLDTLAKDARRNFTDPFWKGFFGNFLPGEASRSVDILGRSVGNFLHGAASLIEAFSPLAHTLEDDLLNLSKQFAVWAGGTGPIKFVDWAEKNGPPAAKALEALGKAVGNLAIGFAPLGAVELKLLTPAITAVGDFSKAHPKVIRDVGLALLTVGAGLKAISLAQGAAGILSKIPGLGGKVPGGGGGGPGGVAGAFGGRGGSPASPLYVFVVDEVPGGGGGVGGVAGAGGASKAARIAGNVTLLASAGITAYVTTMEVLKHTPVGNAVTSAADAYANWFGIGPKQAAQREQDKVLAPAGQDLVKQYGGLDAAIAAERKQAAAGGVEVGSSFSVGISTAIRTKLGPAASKDSRISIGQIVANAERTANDGGYSVGEAFTEGLAAGLAAEGKKARALAAAGKLTNQAIAQMQRQGLISSPSKKTMYLGEMLAEGLAVGFTGYSSTLLAKVGKATGGVLNHLGVQLNNAANQYRADLQARADSSASIAQGIMGSASIANVIGSNTGGASVGGFLGGQVNAVKTFAARLAALRKRGLDPRLLQQLVDAGPQQGSALAQQILSGSQGYIRGLNAQERTLSSLSTSIGGTVAGANFAGPLARDQKSLDRAAAALEKIVGERLHLNRTDMQQLARDIASQFAHVFPTLNLTTLDHALGIQIVGG